MRLNFNAGAMIPFLTLSGLLLACGSDDSESPLQAQAAQYPESAPPMPSVLVGSFTPLPGYAATVSGRALLARNSTETRVSVQVNGLVEGTTYSAHVHEWPCSVQSGGGHYKRDPSIEDVLEENEIWPVIEVGETGSGRAEVVVPHVARGDALSVVVHDSLADGAKLACADLTLNQEPDSVASGNFAAFAGAVGSDLAIGGSASLTRNALGTSVEVSVTGLSFAEQYRAHVHALPCGVMEGGGHYKFDPSVADALVENELWPEVVPDASGAAQAVVASDHATRLDAQSVVIHRVTVDGAPKVACANLTFPQFPSVATQSSPVELYPVALERDYGRVSAEARMVRSPSGTTNVSLSVSGLARSTDYAVHVHAQPCGVGSGGGHYKLDPSVGEAIEANEIWLPLSSDELGVASNSAELASHVARAEAQSIVVHDPSDGAKLACIDFD